MAEQLWERRECVSAEVDGSLVLLDLENLVYHSLNSTAADMWDLLDTPKSAPVLVGSLVERYEVTPEHCAASVDRLLRDMEEKKLVKTAA